MSKDKRNMMEDIHADLDEILECMRCIGYDQGLNAGREIGFEEGLEKGYKRGRESVVLPHPCDGPLYENWSGQKQLDKVREELDEVVESYECFRACVDVHTSVKALQVFHEQLMRECTDLIVATTTFMNRMGFNESDRQRLMYKVNESNAKRDDGRRFKKE